MGISTVHNDNLAEIFNFCDPSTLQNARLTCKPWQALIDATEIIFRKLCQRSSQEAIPVDGKWKKRWEIMKSYSMEECTLHSITLQTFLDRQLQRIEYSLPFFQDEVLLANQQKNEIYRCNYLKETCEALKCKIKGTVSQVYCHGLMVAINVIASAKSSLIIYDLQNDVQLKECPMKSEGWIKYFDGAHLVFQDVSNKSYYLIGQQNVIQVPLKGSKWGEASDPSRFHKHYFDGRFFACQIDSKIIPQDVSGTRTVDVRENHTAFFSAQFQLGSTNVRHQIIDEHTFADVKSSFTLETKFEKISYDNSSNNNNLSKKAKSVSAFNFDGHYPITALQVTKDIFVAGVEKLKWGLFATKSVEMCLALWKYKDKVTLIKYPHLNKIEQLVVQKGRILASADGVIYLLFDFTGMPLRRPLVSHKFETITQPSSSKRWKKSVIRGVSILFP